jgi:membrane protein
LWSPACVFASTGAWCKPVWDMFLGLYFANTSFTSTYRAAGLPLVLLLWVYYLAQIFFWGAEFTKVYTRTVRSQWEAGVSACPATLPAVR